MHKVWPYASVCGVGVALDYTVNRGAPACQVSTVLIGCAPYATSVTSLEAATTPYFLFASSI